MKHKVATLEGALLDAAVARCEANFPDIPYSTNWLYGGPIIESERISFVSLKASLWQCCCTGSPEMSTGYGPTILIAAMRAYVASKFGDEVELPNDSNAPASTHK